MSDDETRPIEPGTPAGTPPTSASGSDQTAPEAPPQTPPQAPAQATAHGAPPYAMPVPAGYYPGYAAPERPRFVDQVLGMRAVIAVAVACLLIGGLSGWILGHASAQDDGGSMRGGFHQPGAFQGGPGQQPNQQFGQQPNQQFGRGGTP